MMAPHLSAEWRARADALQPFAPAAAAAFRQAAAELEEALRDAANEALPLADAARESGYSERRLRELMASGDLPNAGKKGRPRIRRADLPRKHRRARAAAGAGYDAADDARAVLARGRP